MTHGIQGRAIFPQDFAGSENMNPAGAGASGDGGDPGPRKRGRRDTVHSACATCRRGKTKCDGMRPSCGACAAKGIHCTYPTEPGQTRQEALKSKNAELQTKLHSMRGILSTLRILPPEEAARYLNSIPLNSSFEPVDENLPGSPLRMQTSQSSSSGASSLVASSFELIPLSDTMTAAVPNVAILESAMNFFSRKASTLFFAGRLDHIDAMRAELGNGLRNMPKASLAEICAICAVGMDLSPTTSSPELADAFYETARVLLENIVGSNLLRAMKICTLLAAHCIVNNSSAALSYIEQGINIGRRQGFHRKDKPAWVDLRDWVECTPVFKTLLCFCHWLIPSLSYDSAHMSQTQQSVDFANASPETATVKVIRTEISKIYILMAILFTSFSERNLDIEIVLMYNDFFQSWHSNLLPSMQFSSLVDQTNDLPRFLLYCLHLVFLSASTLLYQCIMHISIEPQLEDRSDDRLRQIAYTVGKNAAVTSKQGIRIVGLILSEKLLTRRSWICALSAYASGAVALHRAYLQIIDGASVAIVSDDIIAAAQAIDALQEFAKLDSISHRLHNVLSPYLELLKQRAEAEHLSINPSSDQVDNLENPFRTCLHGASDLHRGVRDLAKIVSRPLGTIPDESAEDGGFTFNIGTPETFSQAISGFHSGGSSLSSPRPFPKSMPASPDIFHVISSTSSSGEFDSRSDATILGWINDRMSLYDTELELRRPY